MVADQVDVGRGMSAFNQGSSYVIVVARLGIIWAAASAWNLCVGAVHLGWFAYGVVPGVGRKAWRACGHGGGGVMPIVDMCVMVSRQVDIGWVTYDVVAVIWA